MEQFHGIVVVEHQLSGVVEEVIFVHANQSGLEDFPLEGNLALGLQIGQNLNEFFVPL